MADEDEVTLVSLQRLERKAKENRFDSLGYRRNRPLRRRIFYSQPYLTCQYCNTIYFINTDKTRYLEAIHRANHGLSIPDLEVFSPYRKGASEESENSSKSGKKKMSKPVLKKQDSVSSALTASSENQFGFPEILVESDERLPPCRNCLKVDGLVHGAYDFTDYILEERRKIVQRRELEMISSAKIIQCYRNYLMRQYGRSIRQAMKTIQYLQFLGALKITALGRGRLARRRYQTEKGLKIIRTSHPLLIKYALRSKPGQKKVFWYKRQVEQQMLFDDYLLLLDKTGHNPPRLVVERNVIEIAKRILLRKNELIVLVQKLWRGFLARRIVRYFATEIARMFSLSVARVIKIQRVFRGHYARVHMAEYLYHRFATLTLEKYQKERYAQYLQQQKQESKERSLISYRDDYQVEKTTRYLGKLPYAVDYNKDCNLDHLDRPKYKLQIFESSYHSDHRTMNLLADTLVNNQQLVANDNRFIYEDIFRKQFILNRIDEKGPLGYGRRSGESDFLFTSYKNIPLMNTQEQIEAVLADLQQAQQLKKKQQKQKQKPGGGSLKAPETSRQKAMRYYFQEDLTAIANRVIERVEKGQPALGSVDMTLVEKTIQKMKKEHRATERLHRKELVPLKDEIDGDSQTVSTASTVLQPEGEKKYSKHSLKLLKEFKIHNRERLQPLLPDNPDNLLLLPGSEERGNSRGGGGGLRSRKTSRAGPTGGGGGSAPSSRRQSRSDNKSPGGEIQSSKTLGNELALIESIPEHAPSSKRKVIKGYQYPKDLQFNAMAWLYSNEED